MNRRTKYLVNHNRIEIIVTYECNRNCYNCEAQVRQAPSKEKMTVEQIEKFVSESIANSIKWEYIRVLGGEPTLHKDIHKIIEIIANYKNNYSPETIIVLVTNGYGAYVNKVIDELKEKYEIKIENSNKNSDIQSHFSPINQAPIDLEEYKDQDLEKGCWIPTICGIALDLHGYYPCSASAAADRVFGYDLGRKSLPQTEDSFLDLYKPFCHKCGHYYNEINDIADFEIADMERVEELEELINANQDRIGKKMNLKEEIISPVWEKALRKWRKAPPTLLKY